MRRGLYLHIPFCKQKCKYCDFASFAGKEPMIDVYLGALSRESALCKKAEYHTLYVGGGTPSLLSETQIEQLCQIISKYFGPVASFEESTFEANPESLTASKAKLLRILGFNRLSMGLQSFNDAELKTIGRVHTARQFLAAYQTARKAGFTNINVDLMAGLPGQTEASFKESLQAVAALEPEHLSVYGLQIEEGTVFFKQGVECDEDLMRTLLEQAHDFLTQAGYHHYEISNFAKPGQEAKHNLNYWQNGEYLGLGCAAASYQGGERRQNTPDLAAYITCMRTGKMPVVFSEKLERKARVGETLLLGLRQLDGVEITEEERLLFGKEIDKNVRAGLLTQADKKVKLTREGFFLANEVFRYFVAPFEEL